MTLEAIAEEGLPQEPRIRNLRGGAVIYYRQPNGHIAPASGQKMDMSNYIEGGWRPLQKYGSFLADHVNIHRPLDHLFRQGGAKELPVSQLVEEAFAYPVWGENRNEHYKVDGRVVEFPQLAGATIPPLRTCDHCSYRGIPQAIANHEDVMHQRDLAPIKMGKIFAAELRGKSEPEEFVPQPFAYVCGKCGQGFNGHMGLARHVKGEHKNGG